MSSHIATVSDDVTSYNKPKTYNKRKIDKDQEFILDFLRDYANTAIAAASISTNSKAITEKKRKKTQDTKHKTQICVQSETTHEKTNFVEIDENLDLLQTLDEISKFVNKTGFDMLDEQTELLKRRSELMEYLENCGYVPQFYSGINWIETPYGILPKVV
jgi:hypothetical protein